MGGHDPYSSSKGCAELITNAYLKSYYIEKIGLASARAGNVIGGGDWATDRLIPDLLRTYNNKPVKNKISSIYPSLATCGRASVWLFIISRKAMP